MLFGVARGNGNIVETVRRVEGTSPTAVDSARGPAVPENPPEQPHETGCSGMVHWDKNRGSIAEKHSTC